MILPSGQHGGAIYTRNKYRETEIKRETETAAMMETTATTEIEMTALNKTIPNYKRERQQINEYETSGVSSYLI